LLLIPAANRLFLEQIALSLFKLPLKRANSTQTAEKYDSL